MHQNHHNEHDAFSALQGGEESGLLYYFNRYYSLLVLFSNSLLRDEEVAREVASDAFCKLWTKREGLQHAGAVKAWLYRAVSNASIDYLRQQKTKRKRVAGLYAVAEEAERNVFQKLVEAELVQRLHLVLQTLPPRTRRILELFYFEEKSVREVADELQLSVEAVKGQKKRALQMLRERKGWLPALLFLLVWSVSWFP